MRNSGVDGLRLILDTSAYSRDVSFVVDVFEDQKMKVKSCIVSDPDDNAIQFIEALE